MSKYDEVLRPFVALMEKELHANSHKGDREGWLQMTEEQTLGEIEYHVSKLSKAMTDMNPDGVREYAADVASLCMMLLDIGGQLKADPTPPQPIYDEPADIAELRAELNLAKRYLRQTLAAHNPRSRLSCDMRRLIGMNPIGAKSVEVDHE